MAYPSDLTDTQWDCISHHFATGKYGNRAIHSRRSLVNGILYVVKTGCGGCYRKTLRRGRRCMDTLGAYQNLAFGRKFSRIW